jgi:uncharacterized protein (DUF1330 family)
MTSTSKLTLTVLATATCLGPIVAGGLHAQVQPASPAYVVNEIEVTDQAGFATYATREGALIAQFGGRFLVRGGKADTVEGALPGRVTIYVFDSMAKARAWREAPQQTELDAIRDRSSRFHSYVVEGCATCAPPAG